MSIIIVVELLIRGGRSSRECERLTLHCTALHLSKTNNDEL